MLFYYFWYLFIYIYMVYISNKIKLILILFILILVLKLDLFQLVKQNFSIQYSCQINNELTRFKLFLTVVADHNDTGCSFKF